MFLRHFGAVLMHAAEISLVVKWHEVIGSNRSASVVLLY